MSYEQAVVNLQETNAELVKAVNRVRDAAMGMNRMHSSTSAGVAAVQDGEYFVVPGGGVYQRLYQRSGGSATLIAEYPDASEVVVQSEIGTAASHDVTTSQTDMTPQRLLRFGDFGIGQALSETSTSDFNLLPIGRALTAQTSLVNAPRTSARHLAITDSRTALFTQFALTRGNNSFFVRSGSSLEQVSDWVEFYSTKNVVGTVSESGGVPTGAVIERGSNANGYYTKFADGTLICYSHITLGYVDSSRLADSWNLPHSFGTTADYSYSFVLMARSPSNVAEGLGFNKLRDSSVSEASHSGNKLNLQAFAPSGTYITGDFVWVSVQAIGRWY